ncbi:hypothetical protein G6045_03530 [Streptomyces sp. YC504]|uniref:Uncharacterized protein n=1 Tax=Streptomyces mesophilus TaxID=1775132 RepID=A0A6G4XC75_9ACTN|nr:hypothetical protein [Streptomyces mesophilus]NGO74762.1 hypothetical protein [Streptomyces mesophilus]
MTALTRPFAFRLLVQDLFLRDEEAEALGVHKAGLDELCETSDVITVHREELEHTA